MRFQKQAVRRVYCVHTFPPALFMAVALAGAGCGESSTDSGASGSPISGGWDASVTDGPSVSTSSGSGTSSQSSDSASTGSSNSASAGSGGSGPSGANSSGSAGTRSSGTTGTSGSSLSGSTGSIGMDGGSLASDSGAAPCTTPDTPAAGADANCSAPTPPTAKDSVTLDMSVAQGAPTYLASGFIYGLSQDGTAPPDALLQSIKLKGSRAGRGVTSACNPQVWATNFGVMKAYYSRTKALGATLLLLVSDAFSYSCPVTGGSGTDWSQLDLFLSQMITAMQAAGMTGPDVRWELWNEPDLAGVFWNGTQAQWLDTWKHMYQTVRAALPNAVIEGPSVATGPGGQWAGAFLDFAKANDVMPDYVSWHEEGGGADPVADLATMKSQLMSRSITTVKGFDANEYGTQAEQNPGHSAWYLARFDRAGYQGMRGNWAGGTEFFSNMADLVVSNWQPNSQYWIYERYADQTGLRTSVEAGQQVDAVAYQDACAAKSSVIVGNKGGVTGAVNVVVENVPGWLQTGGATRVLVEQMPTGSGALSAPVVVSDAPAAVTCNSLTVTIDWTTATDGYVLTLTPP